MYCFINQQLNIKPDIKLRKKKHNFLKKVIRQYSENDVSFSSICHRIFVKEFSRLFVKKAHTKCRNSSLNILTKFLLK